jgi:hypothetical protein
MALSKSSMAQKRLAELVATYPDMPMSGDTYDEMLKYFEADSSGIIQEFTVNATVLPGTFTNSSGDVTGTGKVS